MAVEDVKVRNAERARLAIGLVTASEWDCEERGDMTTTRAYLDTCSDVERDELMWGLLMLARAGLGATARLQGRQLMDVVQDCATGQTCR